MSRNKAVAPVHLEIRLTSGEPVPPEVLEQVRQDADWELHNQIRNLAVCRECGTPYSQLGPHGSRAPGHLRVVHNCTVEEYRRKWPGALVKRLGPERALLPCRVCERSDCGATFTPRYTRHIYCSERCQMMMAHRNQRKYPWKKERKCAYCGNKFVPNRAATICCSTLCRDRFKRGTPKPVGRVCALPGCENVFRSNRPTRKYCSLACTNRAQRIKRQEKLAIRLKMADSVRMPGDWTKKPLWWQVAGAYLFQNRQATNVDLAIYLERKGVPRKGEPWPIAIKSQSLMNDFRDVRKWVGVPGRTAAKKGVNTSVR